MDIKLTSDGSHSLYSTEFNALYHSKHGAIQESNHVFIGAGLLPIIEKKSRINIFEMGFGTGLNMILTFANTKDKSSHIHYESVEIEPVPLEIIHQLNYQEEKHLAPFKDDFIQFHESSWDTWHKHTPNFIYKKNKIDLKDFHSESKFDLVYFDAFAPNTQEELWTEEIFAHIAQSLNPGAALVSYCAKGSFKRALQSAGFKIEKIPGPPGKREMIRAHFYGI